MKTYRYHEPGTHGEEITVDITEDQIIAKYWDYWCERMRGINKGHLIGRANCIEDFIVVHWAYEVNRHEVEVVDTSDCRSEGSRCGSGHAGQN